MDYDIWPIQILSVQNKKNDTNNMYHIEPGTLPWISLYCDPLQWMWLQLKPSISNHHLALLLHPRRHHYHHHHRQQCCYRCASSWWLPPCSASRWPCRWRIWPSVCGRVGARTRWTSGWTSTSWAATRRCSGSMVRARSYVNIFPSNCAMGLYQEMQLSFRVEVLSVIGGWYRCFRGWLFALLLEGSYLV